MNEAKEIIDFPGLHAQHIVLEGNQAFVRNPVLVDCGQVAATGAWRNKIHGPFSKRQMSAGTKPPRRPSIYHASVCNIM